MNDLINDIQGMTKQIEALSSDLAGLKDKRASAIRLVRELMADATHRIEQMELAEAFAAGDTTVVRDESAGNGAGGYRRETRLTSRLDQTCVSARRDNEWAATRNDDRA